MERILVILTTILNFVDILVLATSHHQIFDLSHDYHETMPVGDGGGPPEISLVELEEENGLRSQHYDLCIGEKLGTHINAPSTYKTNQNNLNMTVDMIPLKYLVNLPGIILDPRSNDSLKEEDTKMRSLSLNLTHLEHWERHHGRIPHGSFVILRSGWADYYQFHDKFFGYFSGEVKQMFPEFTYDAIQWLLDNRSIAGIGTECPDVELTQNGKVKLLIAQRNRFSVVQLTNLQNLPPRDFNVNIAPLKLRNGSGGPARVFATLSGRKHKNRHNSRNNAIANRNELCKDYIKVMKRQEHVFSSAISIKISFKSFSTIHILFTSVSILMLYLT